jgi:hypothetical protein
MAWSEQSHIVCFVWEGVEASERASSKQPPPGPGGSHFIVTNLSLFYSEGKSGKQEQTQPNVQNPSPKRIARPHSCFVASYVLSPQPNKMT